MKLKALKPTENITANQISPFTKNKYGKYLAIGGFAFFFIKGLIWLAVIFSVGFSAFNFI